MEWLSIWDVLLIVTVAVVAGITSRMQQRYAWNYGIALVIYMVVFGATLATVRGLEALFSR